MNALKLLGATLLIVVGVLLIMVISDLVRPYKPIEITIEPDMIILPEVVWEDDINNPDNQPYVLEVAFNEGCSVDEVTQEMFNRRYLRNHD